MTALSISNLVLWLIQIFTVIVLVGLARQVGVLYQRVPAVGPGRMDDGPPIGSRVSQQVLTGQDGKEIPILDNESISLLAFASPHCSACKPLLDSVQGLMSVSHDIRFLVAVDGTETERTACRPGCIVSRCRSSSAPIRTPTPAVEVGSR
jgi:hypothetical protein